jgi:hypothetical protein
MHADALNLAHQKMLSDRLFVGISTLLLLLLHLLFDCQKQSLSFKHWWPLPLGPSDDWFCNFLRISAATSFTGLLSESPANDKESQTSKLEHRHH